jgi:hypothetical protein
MKMPKIKKLEIDFEEGISVLTSIDRQRFPIVL